MAKLKYKQKAEKSKKIVIKSNEFNKSNNLNGFLGLFIYKH